MVQAYPDPGRGRHGHHAGGGHGDADHLQHADASAGWRPRIGRSDQRPRDHARDYRDRAEGDRHVASLGAGHRRGRGFGGGPGSTVSTTWTAWPGRHGSDCRDGAWPGFDLEFGPVFWGLLPAFVFVTLVGAIETVGDAVAIQRHILAPSPGRGFPGGAGRRGRGRRGQPAVRSRGDHAEHDLFHECIRSRTHRRWCPSRGRRRGNHVSRDGVLPQGPSRHPGDPGSGGLGVSHGVAVDALRGRHASGLPGRDRLSEGVGLRRLVLDRRGIPERRDLPRILLGVRRRAAPERHDGRRSRGYPDDPVRGTDGRPSQPDPGRVRRFVPAADQRVFCGPSPPAWGGTRRWPTASTPWGEEGLLTLLQDKSEAEREQRRLLLVAYEEDGGAHLEFIAGTGDENIQDRIGAARRADRGGADRD